MKKILITGMSGTGKSTLIQALAAQGYHAVDADADAYSEWVTVADDSATPGTPVEANRDWVWRVDRIQALLAAETAEMLFVAGCSPNMRQFYPQFQQIFLLSAPNDVILQRLASRTTNPYGKHPAEAARVLDLIATVEPLLRHSATHEIDTNQPLAAVLARVLQIVGQ